MISLCNPGWPELPYVDQAGLELLNVCLPGPPQRAALFWGCVCVGGSIFL